MDPYCLFPLISIQNYPIGWCDIGGSFLMGKTKRPLTADSILKLLGVSHGINTELSNIVVGLFAFLIMQPSSLSPSSHLPRHQ